MALRVLLADESQTIKKVIQLALQDFSVEVKPVHSGIDVIPIAKVFQPDIIFTDVLLAKKTGYEVCKDLKNDPDTSRIPVVLMWNSLMGIDEKKATESKADRRLEKPFEVETLRQIIQELAPKTISNPISSFLKFSDIDSLKESPQSPSAPPTEALDLISEDDDFAQVPLNDMSYLSLDKNQSTNLDNKNDQPLEESDDWTQKKIEIIPSPLELKGKKADESDDNIFTLEEPDLKNAQINVTDNFEEIIFNNDLEATGLPKPPSLSSPPGKMKSTSLDSLDQENLFREEARTLIEKMCYHLIPEIAERVVREEIKKLLQDAEKSI